MPTYIFTFEDGDFNFSRPGDWSFRAGEQVEFESPTGEFVIQLIPESAGAPLSPFESGKSQLQGEPQNGTFRTSPETARGGMSATAQDQELIASLLELNDTAALGEGERKLIARYRYAIAGQSGDKCHVTINKAGSWDC